MLIRQTMIDTLYIHLSLPWGIALLMLHRGQDIQKFDAQLCVFLKHMITPYWGICYGDSWLLSELFHKDYFVCFQIQWDCCILHVTYTVITYWVKMPLVIVNDHLNLLHGLSTIESTTLCKYTQSSTIKENEIRWGSIIVTTYSVCSNITSH